MTPGGNAHHFGVPQTGFFLRPVPVSLPSKFIQTCCLPSALLDLFICLCCISSEHGDPLSDRAVIPHGGGVWVKLDSE